MKAGAIYGDTPLHVAVLNPNPAILKMLLKKGLEIEARDQNGETPLCLVRSNYHHDRQSTKFVFTSDEIISILIQAGADVNARDNSGNTPLHCAFFIESFIGMKGIQALLEAGADVNAKNINGRTPLHLAGDLAAKRGFNFLIKVGADVNVKDSFGKKPYLRDRAISD